MFVCITEKILEISLNQKNNPKRFLRNVFENFLEDVLENIINFC